MIPTAYSASSRRWNSARSLAVPAGAGISIDLDLTFTLQMLLFAALIVVLKPLLFDPVLRVFEERERRTDGAKAAAREMQRKAGELLQRYETELVKVGKAAAEERDRMRAETARLEAEILAEARTAAARVLDQGRKEIEQQVERIRFDLGRQSERLARDMAARALGREVH